MTNELLLDFITKPMQLEISSQGSDSLSSSEQQMLDFFR